MRPDLPMAADFQSAELTTADWKSAATKSAGIGAILLRAESFRHCLFQLDGGSRGGENAAVFARQFPAV
jgi:hypothetical protein